MDKIELNISYQWDIDPIIPIDLDIWLDISSKQTDADVIIKQVMMLEEHNFHSATLSISFQDGTSILKNA